MTKSLEDRVAELERYRIAASAEINLTKHCAVAVFMQILMRSPDKKIALQEIREHLVTSGASLNSEAYDKAADNFVAHLADLVRANELRKN